MPFIAIQRRQRGQNKKAAEAAFALRDSVTSSVTRRNSIQAIVRRAPRIRHATIASDKPDNKAASST
jgi:hypothetical protein